MTSLEFSRKKRLNFFIFFFQSRSYSKQPQLSAFNSFKVLFFRTKKKTIPSFFSKTILRLDKTKNYTTVTRTSTGFFYSAVKHQGFLEFQGLRDFYSDFWLIFGIKICQKLTKIEKNCKKCKNLSKKNREISDFSDFLKFIKCER